MTTFALNMKPTIIEDEISESEPFEQDGSELMAAETSPQSWGHLGMMNVPQR